MDVQVVLKRIKCHVQISSDELKMINNPTLEPTSRSVHLFNLIKDKKMCKKVYRMLRDLYCITEIMQGNSAGCYGIATCMAISNVLFPQLLLIQAVLSQCQPLFTIIITTILLWLVQVKYNV